MNKPKLIRITTVPVSLRTLLRGQLRFMNENGFEVVGVSSSGEVLNEVQENEGIRVEAIEMTRQITPIQDLISLWKLYCFLKQEKPQIVHTHTPKAGILGMLAAKLTGVQHRLHTVAGLPLMEATGTKRKLLDFVEKLTYRCATRVYPNSKGLYDFILENKFTRDSKLKVIANGSSNGIDTSYFDPQLVSDDTQNALRKELGIGENDFVFVFIGRIVKDKGINELVEAFTNLKLETLNFKLLLVGPFESDLDPLLPQTLEAIKGNPHIISVGYQNDVRPYFAISDALVFPSYREGFPNVVMQAGAMGLPSIVSDINGCNEIIVEGQNGIIIPVKNEIALKNAMLNLLHDKTFYLELKSNARFMIQSRYEQTVVWDALLSEYLSL